MQQSSIGTLAKPIGIAIDLQRRVAYVRYREGRTARTVDVWLGGRVSAEIAADDSILGIKVTGLDATTLGHARHYASEHRLGFPALKGIDGHRCE